MRAVDVFGILTFSVTTVYDTCRGFSADVGKRPVEMVICGQLSGRPNVADILEWLRTVGGIDDLRSGNSNSHILS